MSVEALPSHSASREIFTGLAHYSWQERSFSATAIGGIKGRYRVRAYGHFSTEEPHPVCDRILDLAWRHGRVTLIADSTADRQDPNRYALAFKDPIVMVRDHLVVVGDRRQRKLMSVFAANHERADRVAARLDLDPRRPEDRVLVSVCRNAMQVYRASGRLVVENAVTFAGEGGIYVFASGIVDTGKEVPASVKSLDVE